MSFNRVILLGNITRDIECRSLSNTTTVAQIGLAMNHKWKDKTSGEMKEEVTFVDCEAFGKTAENIARFFSKGKPILVEGRLKLDTWKDKTDGSNRSKLKVVIESFEFVGGKSDDAPAARHATRPSIPARSENIDPADVPF